MVIIWSRSLTFIKICVCAYLLQDTRVRATEKDLALNTQSITISNQSGDESTYTILTRAPQDTQRWMEAFWQHFYDMSKYVYPNSGSMRKNITAEYTPCI